MKRIAKKCLSKKWVSIYENAYEHSVPEPYAPNSQTVYAYMTSPITTGREIIEFGKMPKNKRKRDSLLMRLLDSAAERLNKQLAEPPKFNF